MKRILFLVVFGISMLCSFAQEKKAATIKNEGNEALRNKDYKAAMAKFEAYFATSEEGVTEDFATMYNLGYSAYKDKSYDKSIQYMQKAIDGKYSKAEKAYQIIAYSYKKKKDLDNYEATLLKAREAYPNSKKIPALLSKHYLSAGNKIYSDGASILQLAAVQVNAGKYTTEDEAYKVELSKAKKKFQTALPLIEKALEVDPNNATAKTLKENIQKNL